MFNNVGNYLDRLVNVVRPRSLLFLAIDGVAPRAKMNQQRSRRFRSAQEAREAKEVQDQVRSSYISQGKKPPPDKEPWDSNVITPGTDFMAALSEYVKYWIRCRVSEGGAYWRTIKVVFSDAFIPGEGGE